MNMVNLLPGNVQKKIQKQNSKTKILMESLILAQDERWRHA